MPATLRCTCTTHKCKENFDSAGIVGTLLNARTYRAHQQDDKNAILRDLVTQTQTKALQAQEASLSEALAGMSVTEMAALPGIAKSLPDEERYQVDRARKLVYHVSGIKDDLAHLREEVQSIGTAPSTPLSDRVISTTLKNLDTLRTAAKDLDGRLSTIYRRSKVSSVVVMRDEIALEFKELYQLIKVLESSWEALLASRHAQHDAELERGATEFNSGERCHLIKQSSYPDQPIAHHFQPVMEDGRAIIQLVTFMVVACHVILGVSRRGCSWIFSMIEYIMQTMVHQFFGNDPISAFFRGILSGVPHDIRTAAAQFDLEAKAIVYAACPKCHSTYKPTTDGTIPLYQERCNFRRFGSRCRELIVRPKTINGIQVNVPIRTFVAFDFKDWVAGLLARPGYETMMDGAWERMATSPDGQLKDIFQGSTIRDFKGPDKRTHFSLCGGPDAGRYLFSLSYDSFNPLRNLAAGKKPSIGVISLVCVNLPIELRYQRENMFLAGIVPGPHEPPLDAINPYLRPIVDAFLEFWNGVRFTCTSLYALGRLILCAIIVVICDSPAARKVGGFASFGQEHFCTFCECNKTLHGYRDINIGAWEMRTNERCRASAQRFRDATSAKAASSTFDRTGMRWSELLRLPYYHPARFLVVDPMHCLFLGLIKEHFQGILGYRKPSSLSSPSDPLSKALKIDITDTPSNPLPVEKAPRASVRRLVSWLEQPMELEDQANFDAKVTEWGKSNVHVAAFVYVGHLVGCLSPATNRSGYNDSLPFSRKKKYSKKDLADILLSWVCLSLSQLLKKYLPDWLFSP